MTDVTPQAEGGSASLHGRAFRPVTAEELAEAVELAMDYRGDVTIELTSGEMIEGYLFNRETNGEHPWVEIFPVGVSSVRQIPYSLIRAITFTGKDAADGKSWEAWRSKKESERKAEAKRIEEEARSRGLL